MPKTKRDVMKRKLAMAYDRLEASYIHIAQLEVTFRDTHGDLADGLVCTAELVQSAQTTLEAFAWFAWEMDKESIQRYKPNQ